MFSFEFVDSIKMKIYYLSQSVSMFQYRSAEIQDFQPIAIDNLEFNGCKMTSPDFNIASPDTIDGGPVVEIIDSNPNQIIVQSAGSGGTLSVPKNKE